MRVHAVRAVRVSVSAVPLPVTVTVVHVRVRACMKPESQAESQRWVGQELGPAD